MDGPAQGSIAPNQTDYKHSVSIKLRKVSPDYLINPCNFILARTISDAGNGLFAFRCFVKGRKHIMNYQGENLTLKRLEARYVTTALCFENGANVYRCQKPIER